MDFKSYYIKLNFLVLPALRKSLMKKMCVTNFVLKKKSFVQFRKHTDTNKQVNRAILI